MRAVRADGRCGRRGASGVAVLQAWATGAEPVAQPLRGRRGRGSRRRRRACSDGGTGCPMRELATSSADSTTVAHARASGGALGDGRRRSGRPDMCDTRCDDARDLRVTALQRGWSSRRYGAIGLRGAAMRVVCTANHVCACGKGRRLAGACFEQWSVRAHRYGRGCTALRRSGMACGGRDLESQQCMGRHEAACRRR